MSPNKVMETFFQTNYLFNTWWHNMKYDIGHLDNPYWLLWPPPFVASSCPFIPLNEGDFHIKKIYMIGHSISIYFGNKTAIEKKRYFIRALKSM